MIRTKTMHINRLRLLGFKSFVEPTELVIEHGLTGVVGPNGCGKSNLLEALRWVMGETSYKSMRASSMEDVIFSGTNTRPPRNMAEVTIFIDNADRKAPAEFNDDDVLEVTRRIEREMGSAYRINSREARARDVKILFEDAATGARSPALVRQGQIAEIVNAKPEQRRRILEDAAGIAGLHSRRHEAELRLRAADNNLARLGDILGQLNSQIESLKRQARAARRYKEISGEIRKAEALLAHLAWTEAQAQVDAEEAALAVALQKLGAVTQAEAASLRLEAETAETLPPLREGEAIKGAILQRLKVEQDNFEREARRLAERQRELSQRSDQYKRDGDREEALIAEARDTLKRLALEEAEIEQTNELAVDFERKALGEHDLADAAVKAAELRLSQVTTTAAEARARLKSLEQQKTERKEQVAKLERQLGALETQMRETVGRAPDAAKLKVTTELGQALLAELSDIEAQTLTAEERVEFAAKAAKESREAAAAANLAAGQIRTEIETLLKVLKPQNEGEYPPVVDAIKVQPGFELALGTALGDDLEAPVDSEAPVHWGLGADGAGDAVLPHGVEPLSSVVEAPRELARRLRQIGVVARVDGARLQQYLKPGQRLVTREGDLWRWDGFVAAAHGMTAATVRLSERNRLGQLTERSEQLHRAAGDSAARESSIAEQHRAAEAEERRLRQVWRETQGNLAETRDLLTAMDRQARETEARLASIGEAKERASEALIEANEKFAEVEMAVETVGDIAPLEAAVKSAQGQASAERTRLSKAQAELTTLEREHRMRAERAKGILSERERWQSRSAGAEKQIASLKERIAEAATELEKLADLPALVAEQRGKLMDQLSIAEKERQLAADQLAEADTAQRKAAQELRANQDLVAQGREDRARTETRLENARARRSEEGRKIRENLNVMPDGVLALAEVAPDAALPPLLDVDRNVQRLKADRERLGGVNLAADDELTTLSAQFESMDKERADVEEAIAKLRAGIGQLNKEAKTRLEAAFHTVNGHFQSLFATLFGGGEARLEMIESEEDPLHGGLEIIAKPPGKKPTVLSLLSGGEQTLTALSLIFAVFLTNPSPICVLDEVDAPLDDANVDRFCTMMEKMAADTSTRFLVITHHPMTMARMNRLFGVTMGEKGVSQLVSVDLEAARKFVTEAA
jgi:chromosome segregation protein